MIEGNFRVAVYLPTTGEILRVVDTSDVFAMAEQHREGEDWLPVDDDVQDDTHMVEDGYIVARPRLDVPGSVAVAMGKEVLLRVPSGTSATPQGANASASGEAMTITARKPGDFSLRLDPPFPWRAVTIGIKATA